MIQTLLAMTPIINKTLRKNNYSKKLIQMHKMQAMFGSRKVQRKEKKCQGK